MGQTWTYRQLNFFNNGLVAEVQEVVVARDTSGRYREPDGDKPGGSEYLEDHFRWELVA